MAWRIRICRRKYPNPSGKLEKSSFSHFRNLQKSKIEVFHDNTWNFHDSWVGTDTPGPGEAVFAIRFIGKPTCSVKKLDLKIQKFKKSLHVQTCYFHDSWVGTDTPGHGESEFADECVKILQINVKTPICLY